MNLLHILTATAGCFCCCYCEVGGDFVETETTRQATFHIDGKVKVAANYDEDWSQEARVVVDDGQHIGIVKLVLSQLKYVK